MSPTVLIHLVHQLVFHLFFNEVCNAYKPTWIESALPEWQLSSTHFDETVGWSIIAYDKLHDKIIIFGGVPKQDIDYEFPEYREYHEKNVYIYDMLTDTLSSIPMPWDDGTYGWVVNPSTTNAIIINSIMYFLTDYNLIKLDLSPIYAAYYQIGGSFGTFMQRTNISYLLNYELRSEVQSLTQFTYYGDKDMTYLNTNVWANYSCGPYGIVKDEQNHFLYVLGGEEHLQEVYRINVSFDDNPVNIYSSNFDGHGFAVHNYQRNDPKYGVVKLNITLPFPISTTTFFNEQNGRIYAFRMYENGFNGSEKQIAFTDNVYNDMNKSFHITTITNKDSNYDQSDGLSLMTIVVMIVIVLIGLICVFCTVVIGLYLTKKMKERQDNNSLKQEHLIQVRSDSINDDGNRNECVEMNAIMESLSDEQVDELYKIYLRSKIECLQKCEELGLIDEVVDELLALFERFKAV